MHIDKNNKIRDSKKEKKKQISFREGTNLCWHWYRKIVHTIPTHFFMNCGQIFIGHNILVCTFSSGVRKRVCEPASKAYAAYSVASLCCRYRCTLCAPQYSLLTHAHGRCPSLDLTVISEGLTCPESVYWLVGWLVAAAAANVTTNHANQINFLLLLLFWRCKAPYRNDFHVNHKRRAFFHSRARARSLILMPNKFCVADRHVIKV